MSLKKNMGSNIDYGTLSKMIYRYNNADEEYWTSIYELEQYVMGKVCISDDDFIEVIDNMLLIKVKQPASKSFLNVKEYLENNGIAHEYDELNDNYEELVIFLEQFPEPKRVGDKNDT